MTPFPELTCRCREAHREWAARPIAERLLPIRRLRHLLATHGERLSLCATQDVERNATEVLATDVLPSADALLFLERQASRILKPRRVGWRPMWLMGCRQVVHRRPWGVVGVIGTWNYPIILNLVPIAQALVAGNGILWKPSELAPATAACLAELFAAAGFPDGLIQTLPATREAGPQLVEEAIDHLIFTGSANVGRILAKRLGERLIPSTLELSGCDSLVILDDADLILAAKATWYGATLNRGQTCLAVRRVFVPRALSAAFLDALKAIPKEVRPEPLQQFAQARLAQELVADGIAHGAKRLFADGEPTAADDPPRFPPTVLYDADPTMRICREPSFAPVCAVIPYDDESQLPELIAADGFNLTANLFTKSPARGVALAARIPASQIVINDAIAPTAHPELPFGGRGPGGWGVTRGAEGLLAMTVPQAVIRRSGTFRPHYAGSDEPGAGNVLRGLLAWSHSARWTDRWRGFRQFLRGVRKKST
jgi:acyl-CoA reductase-like NAD-dependent aldehyde dehydrogenase